MKDNESFGYLTIFSSFLIHLILGTLFSWSSLFKYFYSFWTQNNSIKITKVYLNNIFSF